MLPKIFTYAEGTQGLEAAVQAYFEDLCHVQTVSGSCERAIAYICVALDRLGLSPELDDYGNVIVASGDLSPGAYYPGLCAHLDTVHSLVPAEDHVVYRVEDPSGSWIYQSPSGIGGDDKCGVALVLAMLKIWPGPLKAFFFLDEEVGCQGSSAMSSRYFDDVGWLAQPDRRGNSDLIDVYSGASSVNKAFGKVLRPVASAHGYTSTAGLFTDVFYLQDRIYLSALNFSCGYFEPHTNGEYVVLADLLKAAGFLRDLVAGAGTRRYQRFPQARSRSRYSASFFDEDDAYMPYDYSRYWKEQQADRSSWKDTSGTEWKWDEDIGMYVEAKGPARGRLVKTEEDKEFEELFGEEPFEDMYKTKALAKAGTKGGKK